MSEQVMKAAQEIVDWVWSKETGNVGSSMPTIPWDLMWKLRDALEQCDE